MSANSFGLDIGTKNISAVQVNGDKNKLTLHACVSTQMPGNGMMSESSFDLEEIAQTIHKLVNDGNISTSNVHAALPDSLVYTKVVEIPILSDKDLQSAIYWEAEQNIPAPLPTITLSWQVLQKKEQLAEPMMDVLLIGAPTNLVKKYQNVLEMANLAPVSLETEILAVIRSLGLTEHSLTTMVINISGWSTTIAIMQSNILVFTYSIPLGGVAINRAISTEFGFSDQQAEEYKRAYGIADQQVGAKIAKAIDPILQSMISEIRKALAFYADKYKDGAGVGQIILSGSTSTLPGIDVYFVKTLGIETVIANPWKMLNIQNVSQQVTETTNDYSIAVGLAIKDYDA